MGARVQGRGAGSGSLVPRHVMQLASNLSVSSFRAIDVQNFERDGAPDEKRSAGSQNHRTVILIISPCRTSFKVRDCYTSKTAKCYTSPRLTPIKPL